MKIKNDPANYRKMSIPYESKEQANESLEKFYEELAELRKKYKLMDVLVVICGNVLDADKEEGEFTTFCHHGSSAKMPLLAAFVYGQSQAMFTAQIERLAKGKIK